MGEEQVLGVTRLVNALLEQTGGRVIRASAHSAGKSSLSDSRTFSRWGLSRSSGRRHFFPVAQSSHIRRSPGRLTADHGVADHKFDGSRRQGSDRRYRRPRSGAPYSAPGNDRDIHPVLQFRFALVPGFMSPTAEREPGSPRLRVDCIFVLQPVRHRETRRRRICKDAAGPRPGHFSHHVRSRNREPLRAAPFTHCSSLGEHDGERSYFRLLSRPFDFAVCFPVPSESFGLRCRCGSRGDSTGVLGAPYFRGDSAGFYFYNFIHRLSGVSQLQTSIANPELKAASVRPVCPPGLPGTTS